MKPVPLLAALLAFGFPALGQQVDVVIDASGAGPGQTLGGPHGFARGPDGSAWVAGLWSENLFHVDPAGTIEEVLGAWPDLDAAAGLAVAADGSIFVTSNLSDGVLRKDPGGYMELVLTELGAGVGQGLDAPVELVLDADGNLYVAGRGSSNVLRVSIDGVVTQVVGPAGAGPGQLLDDARDVAVDASGTVYVAGLFSDNVLAAPPGGPITQVIGPAGDGAGHPCDGAAALAVGPDGSIYVASRFKHCVLKRTPAGAVSSVIDGSGDGQGHGLVFPADLAFAPDGSLYVAGWGSNNVFAVSPGGPITQVADATGDGAGNPIDHPSDLLVDGDGKVFVACAVSNRVFSIEDGAVQLVATVAGYGTDAVGIGDGALALDDQGRLLVASWEEDEVLRLEPHLAPTVVIDDFGGPSGWFNGPNSIAVDDQLRSYLGGGTQVFRVEASGGFELVLDATGDGAGHGMAGVTDLLFDAADRLFVSGQDSNNVLRLDPDGSITQVIGPEGAGSGQALTAARDLALGDDGTLYAVCSKRVLALDTQGTITEVVDKWDFHPTAPETGQGSLHGVDVDPLDRLVVRTFEFEQVFRWNPDGRIELLWGPGGQYEYAHDFVVDDGGAVYLAIEQNNEHRILRLEPSGASSVVLGPEGDGEGHALSHPKQPLVLGPGRFEVVSETSNTVFSVDLGFCGGFHLLPAALPGDGSGPLLTGEGSLCTGDPWLLRITRGRPLAMASLIIGLTALNAPFKGGTMVPNPLLIVPLPLDGVGAVSLSGNWPNLPAGANLWLQAWIPDPAGPAGFKATNGLRIALE